MYASAPKKQKVPPAPPMPATYLARPRLGAPRPISLHHPSTKGSSKGSAGNHHRGYEKRRRTTSRRTPVHDESKTMELRLTRRPDYADTAYREAVARLRALLAESYGPPLITVPINTKRPLRELDSAGEETDNQSLLSGTSRASRPSHIHYGRYSPAGLSRRYPHYSHLGTSGRQNLENDRPILGRDNRKPPELMSFIERQEEYIEQLENESKLCRNELVTLLRKVKDVISENEDLHDKQKSSLIRSVFNRLETETETETETDSKTNNIHNDEDDFKVFGKKTKRRVALEGPSIVFESRISELEAQLTQCKIELRKALDDKDAMERKMCVGNGNGDVQRKQTDTLVKEKKTLQETVERLQSALLQLRDKENVACDQIKRSLDTAEQAQYEKSSAENEVRRLKDELERQHNKMRDLISEQSRRLADERSSMERRYSQQIDQLNTELNVQWEAASKLQMELDRQKRDNSDLRREIAQKQAYIDELKKETQTRLASMQSDMGASGAEKSALEQQISTLQLTNERHERQSRQEGNRLQAELQSLRQRLDRSDADLIHSRRENIRLSEQVASLEKEINMNAILSEEKGKRGGGSGNDAIVLPPPSAGEKKEEKELSSMVREMESKHAATVAELEGMINSQNQLMDKLTGECHALTTKLEDATARHKEELRELQANLDYLSSRVNLTTPNSSNNLPSQYTGEEYKSNTSNVAQHLPTSTVSPAYSSRNNSIDKLARSRSGSGASVKPEPEPVQQAPFIPTEQQQYTTDQSGQPYDQLQTYGQEQYDPNDQQQYQQYQDDNQYAYDPNQYDPNQVQYDPQQYQQYQEEDPNAAQYASQPIGENEPVQSVDQQQIS